MIEGYCHCCERLYQDKTNDMKNYCKQDSSKNSPSIGRLSNDLLTPDWCPLLNSKNQEFEE